MLLAALAAVPLLAGQADRPGDGGDSDPTTFSFYLDSRVTPLLDASGKPLKPENVRTDYGRHYAVHSDGVDVCSVAYAWKLGFGGDQPRLQPRHQDLSHWESTRVENGWLAVDPATGRFQFASAHAVDDPRRLVHRKQIVLGNITMWQLVARGKFAYTSQEEETHAFQAYDASDPAQFRYAGYSSMGGYPKGLALGEKHLYAGGNGLLSIHNIENPHQCRYVKTFFNGGSGYPWTLHVDLTTRRLYQSVKGQLFIYDISDEDDPVLIDALEGLPHAAFQVRGRLFYGVASVQRVASPAGQTAEGGKPPAPETLSMLRILELAEDAHSFRLLGECEVGTGTTRSRLSDSGILFLLNSRGLEAVDCRKPDRPAIVAAIPDLAPVGEYYDKGPGGHEMDILGNFLYVAAGCSRGGPVNPRTTGLYADHADFKSQVLDRKDQVGQGKSYTGGLRIYDFSDPARLKLAAHLDDDLIGHDAITDVAVGDGVLFLGSRLIGVLAFNLAQPASPQFLGRLSNMGEVEWARLLGDKIYAVSNGVYVIEPYPAEEARLLGWAFTNSWMFGHSVVLNPFPDYNPRKVLFARSGGWHRAVLAEDPAHPKVLQTNPPPVGHGRWVGPYLYTASGNSMDVYIVNPAGSAALLARYPVEGPLTHVEIHENHVFGFGLVRGDPKPQRYLHVFDVTDPSRARLVATHTAPTDTGGMESPDVYFRDGFFYLPGWFAGSNLCGQGWGNFPGIRVLDVRDPLHPRMHALLHHVPADISTNSIACPQSFYVSGNTLYLGDYWTGIHVLDITDLPRRKQWKHLAAVKDPSLPWSCSSYCTSVDGYGRHLYTTHFGHVNIWEIPAPTDVPQGKLTVRADGAR
ncbi:MAG: hypothetical protein HYU36_03130 [Planctomycetes bacterium]|nr:hypothetical protein [Planctomycetota bacterium]